MIEQPDGRFYMPIEQFHKEFYQSTICHYKPNYKQITVADNHSSIGHGVCRMDLETDIVDGITFILTQCHKRLVESWPDDSYEYAPLQVYLCRAQSQEQPEDEEQFEIESDAAIEQLCLLDGARDNSGSPVVYFTRKKLKAGRYFLLYRVAFNTEET